MIFEREKITLDAHFNRLLYLLTCHSKHCINTTCITRVSNVPVRSSRVHFRAILRNTNTSAFIIMSDEENNSKNSFCLLPWLTKPGRKIREHNLKKKHIHTSTFWRTFSWSLHWIHTHTNNSVIWELVLHLLGTRQIFVEWMNYLWKWIYYVNLCFC